MLVQLEKDELFFLADDFYFSNQRSLVLNLFLNENLNLRIYGAEKLELTSKGFASLYDVGDRTILEISFQLI